MFDHMSIGVKDLHQAGAFYDAVLGPLGFRRLYEGKAGLGYGADNPRFWIEQVAKPVPPDPQSGLHICFAAPDRTSVHAFHATALELGGRDNGPPGLRPQYTPTYYAAFVFDPDGYRIEAVTYGE